MDARRDEIRFMRSQYRDSRKRFLRILMPLLNPVLNELGLAGRWPEYRRVGEERLDALDFQESEYGGRYYVNLGVHFSFLSDVREGQRVDLATLRASSCEFWTRLHGEGEIDSAFLFGKSDEAALAEAARLVQLLARQGAAFYKGFDTFPQSCAHLTPDQIEGQNPNEFLGMPRANAALLMARVMHRLGDRERCRAFAEMGLRLRELDRAIISKSALEGLRDGR